MFGVNSVHRQYLNNEKGSFDQGEQGEKTDVPQEILIYMGVSLPSFEPDKTIRGRANVLIRHINVYLSETNRCWVNPFEFNHLTASLLQQKLILKNKFHTCLPMVEVSRK